MEGEKNQALQKARRGNPRKFESSRSARMEFELIRGFLLLEGFVTSPMSLRFLNDDILGYIQINLNLNLNRNLASCEATHNFAIQLHAIKNICGRVLHKIIFRHFSIIFLNLKMP